MKTKVYLAAPWFTEKQEEVYNKVVAELRKNKTYELLLPRDFVIEDGHDIPNPEWALMVFNHDKHLLDMADVVYAIDWGFNSDAGTAWEIGYACAKNKPVVVVRPREVKLASLMIAGGSIATVTEKLHYRAFGTTEYK